MSETGAENEQLNCCEKTISAIPIEFEEFNICQESSNLKNGFKLVFQHKKTKKVFEIDTKTTSIQDAAKFLEQLQKNNNNSFNEFNFGVFESNVSTKQAESMFNNFSQTKI